MIFTETEWMRGRSKVEPKVREYLCEIGMDTTGFDLQCACDDYVRQMDRKLTDPGNHSELLPSYLRPASTMPQGTKVAAIDIGGTFMRSALATMNADAAPEIVGVRKRCVPGSMGKVHRSEFFAQLVEMAGDAIDQCEAISLCFSYPLRMTSAGEGCVIQLAKQVEIEGLIGSNIVEGFHRALRDSGHEPKRTVVLNDSTATLLGGAVRAGNSYSGHVGFILGTGVNMAYVERNERIRGILESLKHESMVLNVEASRYAGMSRSAVDIQMDASTIDCGDYQFEKMVSGKYLGPLYLFLLRDAADRGLFTAPFAQAISRLEVLETGDVNEFLRGAASPLNALCSDPEFRSDALAARQLAFNLVERAAMYCAVMLAAGVIKSEISGKAAIIAEGGMIRNFTLLHDRVWSHLSTMLEKRGKEFELITVEDAALIGAAVAPFGV